jgi:hypothetical protein
MKRTNQDASPKRPVSPESREKMAKARKDWWAKKRHATPTQADTSAVPNTVPDSVTKEPYSSASNNPDVERGRAEAPATGIDGTGSPASDGNQGTPSGAKTAAKPLSAKQYAANVRNGRRSTGPRTAAGKQKSSLNAYKHGIYVKQMYLTIVEWQKDGYDYVRLACGIRDYYQPKNFMEELCVEKLVMEHIRLARITRQEQLFLASKYAFNNPAMDRILRTRNSTEKAISQHLRELEHLRETGQGAFGKPGTDWPGDSGNNGSPCPSPAVGPQGGVNTDGESALPDGLEDCPESCADLWVESEKVIFQGPPKIQAPASNQSGKSNPTTNSRDLPKTGTPITRENTSTDLFTRAVEQVMGCPYPYGAPQVTPSESEKTKPAAQSQAETNHSPHDKLTLAPDQNAETKPTGQSQADTKHAPDDKPGVAHQQNAKTNPILSTVRPEGSDD